MIKLDSQDYRIRDYRTGDEEGIVALFNQVFGKPMTLHQWRWKYRETGTDTIYAQVAVDRHDNIVGHAGAMPLRGQHRGQAIPFFQICDVMIQPAARGHLGSRNLFTRLTRALLTALAQRFPQAFCYGFPGRRPFLLGERARVYDRIENAVEILLPVRRPVLALPPRAEPLAWTDPRLDRLWTELSARYVLSLIRDRHYLGWRYGTNPFYTYQAVGFSLFGKLSGWAAVRYEHDRLLLVDLLIRRRWLRPALRALAGMAAAEGAKAMHTWLPGGWRDGIGRQSTTEAVTTYMIWKPAYPTAAVREGLYYTMGDADIF